MTTPIVIDFETDAVEQRPTYPPRPHGVAIKYPGKPGKYLAWGHPTENNTTREKAAQELKDVWASGKPLLFHNAKFDLDVAETHFGLRLPPWHLFHDTMFLLFYVDPHAESLGLKPSAEQYLGMPPEERDAVAEWLVKHKIIAANENPGPHICKAPGKLVGKYAVGDVERTLKLFNVLLPKLDKKQLAAYDRDRKLLPIMLENERQGMRVDAERLEQDVATYTAAQNKADEWLRKRLGVRDLNLDNDKDVGDALHKTKVVTQWVMTKGGNGREPQRSVAKANLGRDRFNDVQVWRTLDYRNRLQTVLSMSMLPWLKQATIGKGQIYTQWHQVRSSRHNNDSDGARTGRMSCSRFMNISKKFKGHEHPKHLKLPELPLVRRYIMPDQGHVWNHRDYVQQEFRILAHFEDGDLKEAYKLDPHIDFHVRVGEMVAAMGHKVSRDDAKTGNFADLYGAGVAKMAVTLGLTVEEAGKLRAAIRKATPGVQVLRRTLTQMGKGGEPIRTWGGRLYYCEPPKVIKTGPRAGEMMTFEYKLLNYLVQGSAADCTKEAIIRYNELRKDSRMLVTVHDEINISAPKKSLKREDEALRKAMESIEFDVPMLTDRKFGPSWGELAKEE